VTPGGCVSKLLAVRSTSARRTSTLPARASHVSDWSVPESSIAVVT